MRKLKLLFALSALILGAGGLQAQTDVTSTYITNADFSSTDGWTQEHSSQYYSFANGFIGTCNVANNKTSTTDATHLATEYCFGIQCRWSTNYAAFTQTTSSLPVGAYTLTFDVQNTNTSTTSATYANRFTVTVGGNTYTDTKKEWMSGSSAWTTHSISFTLTEAATAAISLGYGTGSNNYGSGNTPHLYVSHLKLTWTDPLKAAKDALQEEIDKAKLCDPKEGLASAISTAEDVLASATTTAELEEALATLQAADKDAVLRYENGLADATYAAPVVTSFVVNGTFDSGISPWQRTGTYQNNQTANNQQGAFTGNFYENWNGSAQVNKMYQTISNIPNGTYRLDIAAFVNTLASPNESQYVFANNDKEYLTTGTPTAYEVYTVVTTNQIEIGLEQTTATANWMGIDNVSLRYYGAGDVINDAKNASHKLAWEEAKAAAEDALADDAYVNVTGSERDDLETEIGKSEPSTAQGYDDAAADLITATSAFTSAKGVYDAYYEIRGIAVTLGLTPGDAPANAAAAPAATHALNVAVYNATTAANIFDETAVYNPSWTSMGTSSGQHWSGDTGLSYADEWRGDTNPTTRTTTVTLPAGSYILMSAGRGSSNTVTTMSANGTTVTFASNGDMGLGINKLGAASFDAEDAAGFANKSGEAENTGTGWEWRYIPVTLGEETDVTVTQTLTRLSGSAWGSFSDFKILKIGVAATAEDYTALNAAITAAEAKTLGFIVGQYAPYNNVEALTKLAEAKAIDQDADNEQSVVQALTSYLNTAENWHANAENVDIIYNGMFATVAEGQNYPEGWTRTNGWGQMRSGIAGDYSTAYYNQPGSLQYGNNGVYTMPLNGEEWYQLTFSYRSHEDNSNHGVTASVLNAEEGLAAVTFSGNSSTSDWQTVTAFFKTGAAGNYVLTLANSGNTWITNVSLTALGIFTQYGDYDEDYGIYDDPAFAEIFYPSVILARSFVGGYNWSTLVVPFDITNEELVDAFGEDVAVAEFSEESEDANDITVNFNKMATPAITANKPVLVRSKAPVSEIELSNKLVKLSGEANAKVSGTNIDFQGIYDYTDPDDCENPFTIPVGDYFISGNKLYKSAGATSIKPFRAYLKCKSAGARIANFNIEGDETTGIADVRGKMEDGRSDIYDLQGRKVAQPIKGLYVKNGKKVVIK